MNDKKISRREMLAMSAAAGGFTFLPSRALGRVEFVAPSDKRQTAVEAA
jgi:hypothetical protein